MKVIVSHDVDHLSPSEHIFSDLIFPKLWIRSFFEMVTGKIGFKTFLYRLISVFEKRLNRIPEITEYDMNRKVPAVFFFGMDNILGMSYKKNQVSPWIKYVLERGFDAGVHGVEIVNVERMNNEFHDFRKISNLDSFGIRTHYVRYDAFTFGKLADIGYTFDTSEFNKKKIQLIDPYKIGRMWEFPLQIMDGYMLKEGLEIAKRITIEAMERAKESGREYFTFLFHDYMFNDKTYPGQKAYYEWFIDFCKSQHMEFTSYRQAIIELESKTNQYHGK